MRYPWAYHKDFVTREITISSHKITNPLNILLVSDLHCTIFGKNQEILTNTVAIINPDVILLAGDIIDAYESIKGAELFLHGIKNIAPIYYVTGNHEYKSKNFGKLLQLLKECNINILSDKFKRITIKNNSIIIAGIEDYSRYTRNNTKGLWIVNNVMNKIFKNFNKNDNFSIFMAHRPELIDVYLKYDFDMVVSGHTHGGQMRLFNVLNGVIAPGQGFFPKYGGGLYEFPKTNLIISRGLSLLHPKLPRLFNPPEIVSIQLTGPL